MSPLSGLSGANHTSQMALVNQSLINVQGPTSGMDPSMQHGSHRPQCFICDSAHHCFGSFITVVLSNVCISEVCRFGKIHEKIEKQTGEKLSSQRAALLSSQHGLVTLLTEGLFHDPRLVKCRLNQICSDRSSTVQSVLAKLQVDDLGDPVLPALFQIDCRKGQPLLWSRRDATL